MPDPQTTKQYWLLTVWLNDQPYVTTWQGTLAGYYLEAEKPNAEPQILFAKEITEKEYQQLEEAGLG